LVLALVAAAALAFTPVHAEITSSWSVGHDDPCCPPQTSRIVLDRDGPGWQQAEIDALTAALLRPPVPTFDPDRLRFPVAELDMWAHRIVNLDRSELFCTYLLPPDIERWAGPQRARFLAAVHDPGVVRVATRAVQTDAWITDDYPKVHVELRDAVGRRFMASSNAMTPLMLPWSIDSGDGAVRTYDPAIPRAMRPLLAGTPNETRVSDGWFEGCIVAKIAELQAASNEKAAHRGP
jgi:hypothetical protein